MRKNCPYLNRVCIEVTYRYNHCYVFDEDKITDGELSVEQYLKLFDDLRKLETLYVTLTGGDPSQRDDFTKILRGAVERGFLVTIFTNGTGYSEETLAEIIDIAPASMSFSVYHPRRKTPCLSYGDIRRNLDFSS